MTINLDTQTTLELSKIIAQYLLQDISTLLVHLVIGIALGFLTSYLAYKLLKSKKWFKRVTDSVPKKLSYLLLRITFYLGIIGTTSFIGLIMGSNKIIDKEITTLVDQGINYYKENYFKDMKSVEELFEVADLIYSSGYEVNEFNHKIAAAVVDQLVEEKELNFLHGYMLKTRSGDFTEQLEELERGMLLLIVGLGLEKIGAEELLEEDRLDKVFYSWLHSDQDASLGTVNHFVSSQIANQIKPIVIGIWLPFLLISLFFILFNIAETAIYFHSKKYKKRLEYPPSEEVITP
jgi:hypothetical protein